MNDKIEARAQQTLATVKDIETKSRGKLVKIVIATYDRENYAELNREPGEMGYEEHVLTVERTRELLDAEGIADLVVFQPIEASEYWRWIAKNGLPDDRKSRAAFANLKYGGATDAPFNAGE